MSALQRPAKRGPTEWAIVALTGALFTILFLQVALRYVGIGLVWAEELSIAMFIWLVFLGAALAFRRGEHPVVEVGAQALERRLSHIGMRRIHILLTGLIVTVLGVLAIGLVTMAWQTRQLASGLVPGFRVAFLYLGVLGGVLVSLVAVIKRAEMLTMRGSAAPKLPV
jgi:TRAP-type C4-dicarboxylate transport system permease small subunit